MRLESKPFEARTRHPGPKSNGHMATWFIPPPSPVSAPGRLLVPQQRCAAQEDRQVESELMRDSLQIASIIGLPKQPGILMAHLTSSLNSPGLWI